MIILKLNRDTLHSEFWRPNPSHQLALDRRNSAASTIVCICSSLATSPIAAAPIGQKVIWDNLEFEIKKPWSQGSMEEIEGCRNYVTLHLPKVDEFEGELEFFV